jgi:wyosine [tRNA(Phe)-imidazoG37] synthetase (radical SAM superfamily)
MVSPSSRFLYLEPYPSRRIGVSLGVNVLDTPKKCTLNCPYCEIGITTPTQLKPIDFRYSPEYDPERFESELRPVLEENPGLDSITFGYYGEPTLAVHLGEYQKFARKLRDHIYGKEKLPKISIFTNSTTVCDQNIRNTLSEFDQVIAKLDCATESLYQAANRPDSSCPPISLIISCLKQLRNELEEKDHQLAIQTLLFNSTNTQIPRNNTQENWIALANAYEQIQPHIIQLYTVSRIPPERGIHSLLGPDKIELKQFFQDKISKSIKWQIY